MNRLVKHRNKKIRDKNRRERIAAKKRGKKR